MNNEISANFRHPQQTSHGVVHVSSDKEEYDEI